MRVENIILECSRALRLLGAVTPTNAREERERMLGAFARGSETTPRWLYSARDVREIRERLAMVRTRAPELVRQRIDELLLECAMVDAIGTPAFGDLAAKRFTCAREETERLAKEWTREAPGTSREPTMASDSADEGSLLSRMKLAVRAMSLPFDVVVSPTLSALAATGHSTILVAGGRSITQAVARRTVLHEVSGHAAPRARAMRMPVLFAIGTAGGHDDQEGYALLLEERSGCLDALRKHELGSRHLAATAMQDGASFVDVARRFGVLVAERVFRGSRGALPGLGRERIYLDAFLRVKHHLTTHPSDEALLSSGQIAIAHLGALRHPRAGIAQHAE